MSRLSIKKDTLRDLAIRSKNKCAFPGCDHPLLDRNGVYVAQLCHIEAAELGGQRYNPNQTDEERRAASNLLFLCHEHHKVTDNTDLYPSSRLHDMKKAHEALPDAVFNFDLLLRRIEEVIEEQLKIKEILQLSPQFSPTKGSYPIIGPELEEVWTPEEGRFYQTNTGQNTWFKYMMRDSWLHVEQQLEDGAIAYYEVNEHGNVRDSSLPYPINEYHVFIPKELVLNQEKISSNIGTHAIRTTLKWSLGHVIEHFSENTFVGLDCQARCTIDQKQRKITILRMPDA